MSDTDRTIRVRSAWSWGPPRINTQVFWIYPGIKTNHSGTNRDSDQCSDLASRHNFFNTIIRAELPSIYEDMKVRRHFLIMP
jgi:hypothetical protein